MKKKICILIQKITLGKVCLGWCKLKCGCTDCDCGASCNCDCCNC